MEWQTLALDLLFNWPGLFMCAGAALIGATVHKYFGFACLALIVGGLALGWMRDGSAATGLNDPDLGWIANMRLHSTVSLVVLAVIGYGAGVFAIKRVRVLWAAS